VKKQKLGWRSIQKLNVNELKPADLERLVERCTFDIVFYVEEVILRPYNLATGTNHFITCQQKDALVKLMDLVHDKRRGLRKDILGMSIISGKGTGKDAFTSWAIKWFMFCFLKPKIPCVSVSADQLDKVLWSELALWNSHADDKDFFVLQTDKFFRKDVEDNVRGKIWFAFKKAANPKMALNEQVEGLQGMHADYMLQIVDEGSGVLQPVYEALENNQTGFCNLMLVIFNPMHATGYAIDTQYKNSDRWIALRWNAEDSEITNKDNHRRIAEDYGKDSNAYRMNVLGLPPLFDEKTLINPDWVMGAVDRKIDVLPGTSLRMSVDCGGGGDKSIIAQARGNKVYPFKRNNSSESQELVNWVGHEIDTEQPDQVGVDTIGIGWAVEGALRDKKGSIIEAYDCRRTADDPERFENKRAEMYWRLREQFERGTISIPDDYDLKLQLMSIKYEPNKKGLTQIMEKKKLKKEIGSSPDEADALAMLYFRDQNRTSLRRTSSEPPKKQRGGFFAT
jgi:phage terminase large subunit